MCCGDLQGGVEETADCGGEYEGNGGGDADGGDGDAGGGVRQGDKINTHVTRHKSHITLHPM